ncbi:Asp23/Gls24 family envelope stress response protein [Cerasibacillus terrae]|uniref:Asp23/Gls24 family envelope stress response protein n=1 Tax=Cerasibacillus terrae TaxID=2498845 RepID=A0A5C8P257_9BACI|nr:Asp23/Gls24 family envelope stress response protein [Cerasibacillus terrae]TXL67641.1 Asp23/Gls24 family envelope stress response protein [Cerasibacillus terrae]
MAIEFNTNDGLVTITNEVIATIAGGAAVECYGIVGMASKSQIRDGIAEILKKENYSRGVVVRQDDTHLHVDMYIIVSYGTKISEVAHNVQSQVKYTLQQILGLEIDSVNIYIQGVRVNKE